MFFPLSLDSLGEKGREGLERGKGEVGLGFFPKWSASGIRSKNSDGCRFFIKECARFKFRQETKKSGIGFVNACR